MKSPDDRTLFEEGPEIEVDKKIELFMPMTQCMQRLTRRLEMSFGLWSDATVPKIVGCN